MKEKRNEWIQLFLALLFLPAVALQKLFHQFKLGLEENNKSNRVDLPGIEVGEFRSKQVISQIQVKVALTDGKCHVKNGDAELSAKCNRVLSDMNAFQREFLTHGPEANQNMVFTEVILRDETGCEERRAYFEPDKERDSLIRFFWEKMKDAVSTLHRFKKF
ncbi:hypothetical protein EGW08_023276 [Elysia chlorotica]|uniref:Uncharacterized protein n=1 Tax=Elysia chlorotica TaxID=188477 RepID=A0A3S0Z454_ELYCH|nr:hypothetical protein EGW08_023276 [Elysia chlorotica]